MSDIEVIKAMLTRANIGFTETVDGTGVEHTRSLDIEHDGFRHSFTMWTFNPAGELIAVTAGY